jgi:hypothetical protein
VRSLGRKGGEAARSKAHDFVTSALERAGARVREAATTSGESVEESRLPPESHLATGGLALVDELQRIRRRLEALEAWRRTQEARARKRASR